MELHSLAIKLLFNVELGVPHVLDRLFDGFSGSLTEHRGKCMEQLNGFVLKERVEMRGELSQWIVEYRFVQPVRRIPKLPANLFQV